MARRKAKNHGLEKEMAEEYRALMKTEFGIDMSVSEAKTEAKAFLSLLKELTK